MCEACDEVQNALDFIGDILPILSPKRTEKDFQRAFKAFKSVDSELSVTVEELKTTAPSGIVLAVVIRLALIDALATNDPMPLSVIINRWCSHVAGVELGELLAERGMTMSDFHGNSDVTLN